MATLGWGAMGREPERGGRGATGCEACLQRVLDQQWGAEQSKVRSASKDHS